MIFSINKPVLINVEFDNKKLSLKVILILFALINYEIIRIK